MNDKNPNYIIDRFSREWGYYIETNDINEINLATVITKVLVHKDNSITIEMVRNVILRTIEIIDNPMNVLAR